MPKRLQMILKDREYRDIQRMARARHISIAEWVRQALDLARRRELSTRVGKKLEVIRPAARYDYPCGDIDTMLRRSKTDIALVDILNSDRLWLVPSWISV